MLTSIMDQPDLAKLKHQILLRLQSLSLTFRSEPTGKKLYLFSCQEKLIPGNVVNI